MTEVIEHALPPEAELVDARLYGAGGPKLILLVDKEGGSVDHEFCAQIVSVVSPVLDKEGFSGALEVSSPGIERPLTKPGHYQKYAGRKVRVRTVEALEGRRNFTGIIRQVKDSGVVLELLEDGVEVDIPFGLITGAHLKEDIGRV